MSESIPIGGIVLMSVAGILIVLVAILFFKCLDIPPECCAPSEEEGPEYIIDGGCQ